MLYVDDPKNAAESSSPALQLIDGYTPEYHLNTDISAFDFFFKKIIDIAMHLILKKRSYL
jgi:hypothetical protein